MTRMFVQSQCELSLVWAENQIRLMWKADTETETNVVFTHSVASGFATPTIVRVCPTLKDISLMIIPCAQLEEKVSDSPKETLHSNVVLIIPKGKTTLLFFSV